MSKRYMGIDPGASGAVGVFSEYGCEAFDFSSDPAIIAAAFSEAFRWASGSPGQFSLTIVLERVHAMPGQGVTSMFSFGASYGACQGILAYAGKPYHLVTPAVWKRDLGLGKDKDEALAMARRLFPTASLERKKDIGRGEALLIAEWGRRQGL